MWVPFSQSMPDDMRTVDQVFRKDDLQTATSEFCHGFQRRDVLGFDTRGLAAEEDQAWQVDRILRKM